MTPSGLRDGVAMNSAWPRLVIRLDSEVHSDRIDHLKVVEIRPVDSKVPRKPLLLAKITLAWTGSSFGVDCTLAVFL